MFKCVCGPAEPSLPPLPRKHSKAWLREHYPKRPVMSDLYVKGKKGHYTLGAGKHGKVKAAYSREHGCNVAVKSQKKGQWLVAAGETELARGLNLKHVIRVLDWAESSKKTYLVMEEGRPLRTDGVGIDEARKLLWQMIDGLRELHALDIYHRDIGVYERKKGADIKNVMLVDGIDGVQICKMTDVGKMACRPPAALRPIFARADARGLCRVIHAFMKQCDPAYATSFFWWYTTRSHLRVEDVAAHPWLHGKPCPPRPPLTYAMVYPLHVFAEVLTAPAPIITGRRHDTAAGLAPPHERFKPLRSADA